MKSIFSPWCIGVLSMLLVLTLVCSTAVAQQEGPRRDQDRMEGRGRGQGGMRAMARMMTQPQPVMLIDQGYLYILTGNVLFMLDAETLEQINAVHLIPPPPPEGMMRPLPLPPPPPPPPPAP